MKPENPNVDVFDRDASRGGGYVYTSASRLSCRLATQRSFDCHPGGGQLADRSILDMGCGDGHYTVRYWDKVHPRKLTGVDGAAAAIEVANRRKVQRPIHFEVADVHALPYPDNSFDLALVQSVLHHDENPSDILREAFRMAPVVVIHEPNGNNLGLKFIEKTSRYHREHGEKSYSTRQLDGFIKQAGGQVQSVRYAGFVPMFCPDWVARGMKVVEPLLESLLGMRVLVMCSVVVVVARRK